MPEISDKTIGRLSLYRRLLPTLLAEDNEHVRSHELALMARGTPTQVRRDFMALGCKGRPSLGYPVKELMECIGNFLDAPTGEAVALIGVGNLGRAILAYLSNRRPKLSVKVAFDNDEAKVMHAINGCPCYHTRDMGSIIRAEKICVGIIAIPAAYAQTVANDLVNVGIKGILNFAPVRLHVPKDIFVEDIDISMSLEKAAYFARTRF